MADREPVGWIDRVMFAVVMIIVLGYLVAGSGCADPDFTVAQPLVLAPSFDGDAADAIGTEAHETEPIDDADSATIPETADTEPDSHPATDAGSDTKPGTVDGASADTADTPDVMVSTPGHVDCAGKPSSACSRYTCDEPADCPGFGRCCLVPDGTASTCDCSGASMDSWTTLCLTEGDCTGGQHCTPWAAWDHHGRCL